MKRIYACIAIVAVLLGVAFYSSWKVQSFAEVISADLDAAAEAIRNADHPAARQALADGAARCDQMRTSMNHLLRTADFTELEAALRAADGHLEMNAPEEAFGELTMQELKKIDEVAYVRFASVYRQFADVESFFNELQKLMGDRREPQK